MPENAVVALGWFAAREVGDFGETGKTFMGDFDAVFCAGEDGGVFRRSLAGLAMKHEAGTRFGTGMLGEQEDARMGSLGGGAVAEPGGEGDAEGEFRGDGAHVEDDGAETARLEEEVGRAESLVQPGVRLARGAETVTGCRTPDTRLGDPGIKVLSLEFRVWPLSDERRQSDNFSALTSDFWHRLGTARVRTDRRILFCGSRNFWGHSRRLFCFVFKGAILLGIFEVNAWQHELLRFGAATNPQKPV